MTSRGAGTALSRKNYRLSTEPEKSKVAGFGRAFPVTVLFLQQCEAGEPGVACLCPI
uniref:Uncharacterized protein n=1 Tax=Pavo cristatus TaxID=9049 RepID=A0A8C9EXT7_PAVCR